MVMLLNVGDSWLNSLVGEGYWHFYWHFCDASVSCQSAHA